HKSGIRSFEWTKDSRSIVFLADKQKSDAEKATEKAGDDAVFVDEGPNGQERGDYGELWRVKLADRAQTCILPDPLLLESFSLSPDATKVAVIYRRENSRNGQYHAEVAMVDAATGTLQDITHNQAPEQSVKWAPDGRMLSYLAPSDSSWDLAEGKLW